MAAILLTACGKEGGIIPPKEDFTVPTLGLQTPYKETQPSTQKETQKTTESPTKETEQESSGSAVSGLPQGYTKIEGQGYYYGYPSGWSKGSAGTAETLIVKENASMTVRENINTLSESVGSYTLDQYREAAISQYAQLEGYTYTGYNEVTINGNKGNILHVSAEFAGTKMLVDQYVLIKNKKAYIITYTYSEDTTAANKSEAESIIMTFTIQ